MSENNQNNNLNTSVLVIDFPGSAICQLGSQSKSPNIPTVTIKSPLCEGDGCVYPINWIKFKLKYSISPVEANFSSVDPIIYECKCQKTQRIRCKCPLNSTPEEMIPIEEWYGIVSQFPYDLELLSLVERYLDYILIYDLDMQGICDFCEYFNENPHGPDSTTNPDIGRPQTVLMVCNTRDQYGCDHRACISCWRRIVCIVHRKYFSNHLYSHDIYKIFNCIACVHQSKKLLEELKLDFDTTINLNNFQWKKDSLDKLVIEEMENNKTIGIGNFSPIFLSIPTEDYNVSMPPTRTISVGTCGICTSTDRLIYKPCHQVTENNTFVRPPCDHFKQGIFKGICRFCMIQYLNNTLVINKDNMTIKCPFTDCRSEIGLADICRICLAPASIYFYLKINQQMKPAIVDEETMKLVIKKGEFIQPEEDEKYYRLCPNDKCQAPINKNRGCLQMTCTRCGTQFCWRCGHYLDRNHQYFDCPAYNSEHGPRRRGRSRNSELEEEDNYGTDSDDEEEVFNRRPPLSPDSDISEELSRPRERTRSSPSPSPISSPGHSPGPSPDSESLHYEGGQSIDVERLRLLSGSGDILYTRGQRFFPESPNDVIRSARSLRRNADIGSIRLMADSLRQYLNESGINNDVEIRFDESATGLEQESASGLEQESASGPQISNNVEDSIIETSQENESEDEIMI